MDTGLAWHAAWAFLAAAASWVASTVSGGGGALLPVPLVGFVLGVQAVAPVVTLAALAGGPARVAMFWSDIEWRVVAWFVAGALPGALLGGWLLAGIEAAWLQVVLGLFLVTTVIQFRAGRTARFQARRWMFLPAGIAVSFLSALVGAVGPVLNALYLNLGLVKEKMIGTKSAGSLIMHLAKVGTYAAFGALDLRLLAIGAAAGAGAVVGSWLGKRWLQRFSDQRFRQVAVTVMVLSGILMLWQQRGLVVAWLG